MKLFRKKSNFPTGAYILMIVAMVVYVIAAKGNVNLKSILNVMRQAAPLGIVAIGQTIALLMAGIDLSVGALMTLTNVLACSFMLGKDGNILLAVGICLLVAALVGLVNGVFIAVFNMPPFLITLATSIIIEGVYYVYTGGSPKGKIASSFRMISNGWIGNMLPIALIVWILIWMFFHFVLRKTKFGKEFYFTGANKSAAYLSGIAVNQKTIMAYVLTSLLTGLGGLMISAYIGVASIGVGDSYTLNSIAATVIGGTSFAGGVGSLTGTFPGVLIITFLTSILTMMNIPEAGKNVSQGLIILIMVAINMYKPKR